MLSLLQVTVGFGDITPQTVAESLFTAFIMIVGVVISCSTIANLTNVSYSSHSLQCQYENKACRRTG